MKFLKRFNDINEGKNRIKIDNGQVIMTNLPPTWDPNIIQKIGFDPESMIDEPGNDYNYITCIEELPDKEVKKFISKHVKKFNELD